MPSIVQSACHSAGVVGQLAVSGAIISSEGPLRLVEVVGWLRARDLDEGGALWASPATGYPPEVGGSVVATLWDGFPESSRQEPLPAADKSGDGPPAAVTEVFRARPRSRRVVAYPG